VDVEDEIERTAPRVAREGREPGFESWLLAPEAHVSRDAATVVLPSRSPGLRLRVPGRRGALRLGVAAALGLGGVSAGSLLAGARSTRPDHMRRGRGRSIGRTRARSGSRRAPGAFAIKTGRCGSTSGAEGGERQLGDFPPLGAGERDVVGRLGALAVVGSLILERWHPQGHGGVAARPTLEAVRKAFPTISLVWADGGYAGKLVEWAKQTARLVLEIVRKPEGQRTFEVLPRRWVVERTLSWLMKCRRLDHDYERLTKTSVAMVKWAMVGLMVRRLAPSPGRQPWSTP
jgi:transposase